MPENAIPSALAMRDASDAYNKASLDKRELAPILEEIGNKLVCKQRQNGGYILLYNHYSLDHGLQILARAIRNEMNLRSYQNGVQVTLELLNRLALPIQLLRDQFDIKGQISQHSDHVVQAFWDKLTCDLLAILLDRGFDLYINTRPVITIEIS